MICAVFSVSDKKKPALAGLETLFLSRSANGAGVRASTAFNAGFGIDFVFSVSFFDGGNRALSSAGAAADAFIGNFVSHWKTSSFLFTLVRVRL